jgi:AraC-like DNA-binding protein
MPITDIAAEVGYNSYVTFTRAFIQRKGINASSYRKLKSS